MANTKNCTVTDQSWGESHISSFTWGRDYCYAGYYVGMEWTEYWYVYCMRIKTPKFSGKSEKIAFNISIKYEANHTVNLRYALCSSVENVSNYTFTRNEVVDDTQLAAGTITVNMTEDYDVFTIELESDALKPETDYYLYMWGGDTDYSLVKIDTPENHSVEITYKGGIVYIDNGTSFDEYEVWIDNGTTWEQYQVFIDNGTSWDECG